MTTKEYNKVVLSLSHRLYGYVFKSLGNEDDANDIVQDSFMKLWQHRQKVEVDKAKSWLFTTAYHGLINLVKKNKRTTSMEGVVAIEPSGDKEKTRFELKEVIDRCLATLPEIQKSIILLRDYEGYNYKEIGEMLDLNESQVKVYLFRGRQKIKSQIKDLSILL